MEFVIFRNKYCFRIRKIFDEVHTFFETKGKAGSAESISIYGFFGQDCDGHERVVIGVPRFWI